MNLKRKARIAAADLVNKASKTDLLGAIKDKFGGKVFTHKQCLGLLEGFNHSKKIYALIQALVKEGKIVEEGKGYKITSFTRPQSTEAFVKDFCKGKQLPVTKTRLEIAVSHVVGDQVNSRNRKKAIATIRNAIAEKTTAGPGITKACPRCSTAMDAVVLSGGRQAWFCTNDRVTLPR